MRGRGRGRSNRGRGSCRGRGSRGRGRSRGRGGSRGRSGSRRRGRFSGSRQTNRNDGQADKKIEYNIDEDPKLFFTTTAPTDQHYKAQETNRTRYATTLALLVKNKIQVTQNACIKALAMAWARGDKEMASAFLTFRSQFGLVEVLRSLNMLDAGRQVRVLEKRLKSLQLSATKVNPAKLGKLKSDIDNLNRLKPPVGSASGAVCKNVAKWVREFSLEDLEFFAIHFPKEPWKKLADICHLNPEKDFPSAPWFLPYCFGTGPPPDGSLVSHIQDLKSESVNDLVKQHDIPYSVIKQFKNDLTPESKQRIAKYETKLDTVLWYYEDLSCPGTDEEILCRLNDGAQVSLPNGKLLERLLTIFLLRHPNLTLRNWDTDVVYEYEGEPEGEVNFFTKLIEVAEPRLTSIRLSLESPIVVIGDASGSMEVAIKTSTIIASLLTAICSAKLVFFDTETRDAPFLPKTVEEMLKLAVTTKAGGGTAPAASLLPFYKNKEVVKTFIIVTDEEENEQAESYRFAPLYKKYYDEVYPAHLVFVSFLRGQHAQGQMVTELNEIGFYPKQLRLEGSRPDLTKLDDLFAQLSAVTTSSFQEQLEEAESILKEQGLCKLFEMMKVVDGYKTDDQGN